MTPGTVFINRNPSSPERVWIVAAVGGPFIVAFPLKRFRGDGRDDDTCILRSAHTDARGEWVVSYEEGRLIALEQISFMREHSQIDVRNPLGEEVTALIRQGALRSEFTPGKLQKAISEGEPSASG